MSLSQMRNLMEKAMFLDREIRPDMLGAFCSSNGISHIFVNIFKPNSIPLGKIVRTHPSSKFHFLIFK